MIASFLLSFREGLEAALIVGIVLGALRKVNRVDLSRVVWLGVGLAGVLSILMGLILNYLRISLVGFAEKIFEGTTMLLAAGILTWVLFWMRRAGKAKEDSLEGGAARSALGGNRLALFLLALTAVLREGVELVLFLTAASIQSESLQMVAGTILGLLAAVFLGWIVFSSSLRLSPRGFFRVTTPILMLFAAGMLAHGIHEFAEAGIVPGIISPLWNTSALLPEDSAPGVLLKTVFGYSADPSLTEVAAYVLYLVLVFLGPKVFHPVSGFGIHSTPGKPTPIPPKN
jgi:high-affinity iron transporter